MATQDHINEQLKVLLSEDLKVDAYVVQHSRVLSGEPVWQFSELTLCIHRSYRTSGLRESLVYHAT